MNNSRGPSIFVGNLPYGATEQELGDFFSGAGSVTNVRIPYDREMNRPKGFCFIEFSSEQDAANAVQQFNGVDFMGRQLRVNPANN